MELDVLKQSKQKPKSLYTKKKNRKTGIHNIETISASRVDTREQYVLGLRKNASGKQAEKIFLKKHYDLAMLSRPVDRGVGRRTPLSVHSMFSDPERRLSCCTVQTTRCRDEGGKSEGALRVYKTDGRSVDDQGKSFKIVFTPDNIHACARAEAPTKRVSFPFVLLRRCRLHSGKYHDRRQRNFIIIPTRHRPLQTTLTLCVFIILLCYFSLLLKSFRPGELAAVRIREISVPPNNTNSRYALCTFYTRAS